METLFLNYEKILELKNCEKKEIANMLSHAIKDKGIRAAVFREKMNIDDGFKWDVELPKYSIGNQGATGRCWIYAALHMICPSIIKKHQLRDISLSQNYIAFYDLLEKANYFLEIILETLNDDIDSRLLNLKLMHPIQDAGQWFFFQNIIEKYGIVTQDAMPDTMHSKNTGELIAVLADLLREAAGTIRLKYRQSMRKEELRKIKEERLKVVYWILSMSLGEPPEQFDTTLELNDGTVIKERSITPQNFYKKYFFENYNTDYYMLVNIPTENKPYFENYKVSYLGNVWGADNSFYLNLPMDCLKELVQKQIKDGMPVWFGCDSRVYADRKNGVYSLENFELQKLGFKNKMLNKEENLQYGLSNLTHAMVIKGFSCDQRGKPEKWLVENSYGEEIGRSGLFSMSDQWFDLFVYEVVIHKRYLEPELLNCYEKESIILPPWDVLGNLAK